MKIKYEGMGEICKEKEGIRNKWRTVEGEGRERSR